MRGEKEKGTWREGDEHRESTDQEGEMRKGGEEKKGENKHTVKKKMHRGE